MNKFNHAFDFGFEVISEDEQAEDVTGEMLRSSMQKRLDSLSDEELIIACSCFDTRKED